jgi:hypothetical protein
MPRTWPWLWMSPGDVTAVHGAVISEAQLGPVAVMANGVPPLMGLHSADRGDRDPAMVGVGVGHHPLGPVEQHQAGTPFRPDQPRPPPADAGGISAINGSIRIAGVGPPEAPADFERLSAYGQLAGEVDVPGLRLLGVQVPAARRLRDGSPLGGLCALSRGTDNGAARQGGYRQPRCYVSGSRCLVVTLPGAPGPWPGRLPGCVRRLSVSGTASVPAT